MTQLLQLITAHWLVIGGFLYGAWCVLWSFAPTPQPNTWYNAFFHVAQYTCLNPGRSFGVMRNGNHTGSSSGPTGGPHA